MYMIIWSLGNIVPCAWLAGTLDILFANGFLLNHATDVDFRSKTELHGFALILLRIDANFFAKCKHKGPSTSLWLMQILCLYN